MNSTDDALMATAMGALFDEVLLPIAQRMRPAASSRFRWSRTFPG